MHKRWLMLTLALVPSARALANDAPAAFEVVAYDAPRACPGRRQFEQHVVERLQASGSAPRRAVRVRVLLRAAAGGAHGTVTIESGARRSLEGASCKEVAEGLALITALALAQEPAPAARSRSPARMSRAQPAADGGGAGPSAAPVSGAAEPGQPTSGFEAGKAASGTTGAAADGGGGQRRSAPTQGPREASGAASPAAGSGAGHTARGESASSDRRGAVAGPRDQGQRAAAFGEDAPRAGVPAAAPSGTTTAPGASGGRASAADREVSPRTALEAERPAAARPAAYSGKGSAGLRLGASAMLLHGLAPKVQPGLQLSAAFVQRLDALELSAQLAARLALRQTLERAAGEARFGFAGGALSLCAATRPGLTGLWLRGCAVAEAGALSWSATRTEEPRSYQRAWLALGPGASVWWRGTWLGLGAGAELLLPTRRDRAVLASDEVQRVAAACLRVQLGLELSFDRGQ